MECVFPNIPYARPTDETLARGNACNFVTYRAGDASLRTLVLDICRQHIPEMERNDIPLEAFVGAGTSVQKGKNEGTIEEDAQWGSTSAKNQLKRDRPGDPEEAECVRREIARSIAELRQEIRKRLGWPLAAQGAA
jgi:hypothetical protein